MKLNIIYGKSGTGKSDYIYNDIKNQDKKQKIYLIVPEQSNLTAEKNLIDILGIDVLVNIEVLTLKRMAYRVMEETGIVNKKILNQVGKDLIIYDSLLKRKGNLNFLNKNEKNIDIVSKSITEFKKHNIDVEKIENIQIENKYTSLKMQDIKILYKDYEEKIKDIFIDENDYLSLLAKNLSKTDFLSNSIIYIDEFNGFTPQELNVFEQLLIKAKQVNVAICTNNLKIENKENDIFYFNKKFANKLIQIADNNNIIVEEKNLNNTLKFETEELKIIEKNFSKLENVVYKDKTKNIEIFLADNTFSEVEYVAKQIYKLVEEGYRYKDIAIMTSNFEEYKQNSKIIFEKYSIPLYLDNKKELLENILVKYILAILEIFGNNWSQESIINYIKIGLLDLNEEDIFQFEKYIKIWGIKNKKFFTRFEYEPVNDKQENIEKLREDIILPLVELKSQLDNCKTAKNITTCLYEFLINNSIIGNLNNIISKINDIELINEYSTSYKLLLELFDIIVELFGNEKMTFTKYKELLRIGLSSEELGTIPATQDQVVLGQIGRAKVNDIKVCFLIGVNDGNFPLKISSEGYFNDADRKILNDAGLEMAKDSIDTLYEDEFNIYKVLTIPSQKLYISYSANDSLGGSLRASTTIKRISKMFPNVVERSDIIKNNPEITNSKATLEESVKMYAKYIEGQEIDEEWKKIIKYYMKVENPRIEKILGALNFSLNSQKINKENIQKLYNGKLNLSVSKLEEYQKCPFSYHLKYGLNIKEEKEFKMQAIDTGNFMHEVIDTFFEKIDENNISINILNDKDIKKIVFEIIEEILKSSRYYIFTSNAKYISLTRRLKNVVCESLKYIVYTIQNSRFEVWGHEVEFGKNKRLPAIQIETENNNKIELSGKIDRVDIGKIGNKEYLRIIDYKSSIKNIDLNQVVNGLQIQLITYMDSISTHTNTDKAGILYMSLIENIVKSNKNLTDDEIKQEIKKNFKMQGLVIADINIIKMMDKNLTEGNSDIIQVGLKKDGTISEKGGTAIKKEQFEDLQKEVKKIIKKISAQILDGNIPIKPYKYKQKRGCDFCKFKSICMFDDWAEKENYNYIKECSKEEILEKIKS